MTRNRAASVLLFLPLLLGPAAGASAAVSWRAGIWFGPQTINDSKIRATYGQQAVFRPAVEATFGRHVTAGLAFETGYRRDGRIGIGLDATTLSMNGFNAVLGYEVPIGAVTLYGRAGYGIYAYEQTIDSLYLGGHKVDHRASTVVAGLGMRLRAGRLFFLAAEAEYVPLKVKPYDVAVDLGGFRFFLGAGFALDPPAAGR